MQGGQTRRPYYEFVVQNIHRWRVHGAAEYLLNPISASDVLFFVFDAGLRSGPTRFTVQRSTFDRELKKNFSSIFHIIVTIHPEVRGPDRPDRTLSGHLFQLPMLAAFKFMSLSVRCRRVHHLISFQLGTPEAAVPCN